METEHDKADFADMVVQSKQMTKDQKIFWLHERIKDDKDKIDLLLQVIRAMLISEAEQNRIMNDALAQAQKEGT
jgi:uncharacterized protein YacL (UPF0231 family)